MLSDASVSFEHHRATCCSEKIELLEVETILRFNETVMQIVKAQRLWQGKQKTSLLTLLHLFRNRNATDNRDKVYALLSLVTDWGNSEPIAPDYSVKTLELHRKVISNLLEKIPLLYTLSCSTTREKSRVHSKAVAISEPDNRENSINTTSAGRISALAKWHIRIRSLQSQISRTTRPCTSLQCLSRQTCPSFPHNTWHEQRSSAFAHSMSAKSAPKNSRESSASAYSLTTRPRPSKSTCHPRSQTSPPRTIKPLDCHMLAAARDTTRAGGPSAPIPSTTSSLLAIPFTTPQSPAARCSGAHERTTTTHSQRGGSGSWRIPKTQME
jgi:hypothetical protein